MKTIVALAVLCLISSVSARGGGRSKESRESRESRERGFWGWWNSCQCGRNTCAGNTGTKNVACYNTRSEYLQCVATTCSNQTCPDNQLFNATSLACESCTTGFHVNAQKRRCVCNQGTTLNFTTGTCGPCPSLANITADACFCSGTTPVLDKVNNACKACPTGSTQTRDRKCRCTNALQFWSTADFACKDCPGAWVNITVGSYRRPKIIQVCQCQTANNVINKYSVTCVACPANSVYTQRNQDSYCRCTVFGEVYDPKTNTCVARSSLKGFDSYDYDSSNGSYEHH